MKVRYVGWSTERIVSRQDFEGIGVDQDGININTRVSNVVEMSQEAADKLMELEPSDWHMVDTDTPEKTQ